MPQLTENGASWSVHDTDRDVPIRGQREILVSVFANLAKNALDACGQSARLDWQVDVEGQVVCIVLQDNGPGVAAEMREQIFEPFFTTRASGTGLGLAVVRAMIDAHGGGIELDPAYRNGARFVLTLPLLDQQQLPSGALKNHRQADFATSRYLK